VKSKIKKNTKTKLKKTKKRIYFFEGI